MTQDTPYIKAAGCFVFESTESLAEQLVEILGKSGWKMIPVPQEVPKREVKLPARGEGGKFLPKVQAPKDSV